MERYRTYFRWAGGLAIAYAGLLLASWLAMAVGLGPGVYELAASSPARAASFAFLLTFLFFLASLAGFALHVPLLANGGIFFQTLAQAAAFALAGVAVWSAKAD